MKILDRYIRRTVIMSTVFVSVVLIAIESFLDLISELHHIGQQHYGIWQALLYVPMQLPAEFYQLFPMAGFLGCLIGLGRLSSSSQLIIMRSSGVSIMRIAWSVVKAGILMIVVMTFIGEGLGPFLQQKAEKMKAVALTPVPRAELVNSLWLRKGDTYTHISQLKKNNTIIDFIRYRFAAGGRLLSSIYAPSGRLINGRWQLTDLQNSVFKKDRVIVNTQKKANVQLLLKPALQVQMEIGAVEQTLSDLYHTIKYRRSIGLSAKELVFSFWQRVFQPITSLVMIVLGVPFLFGSLRSSSMGLRILTGVVVGFGFYMLNQLFGPMSMVYQYPAVLAAATPTLIFLGLMLILLLRVR